MLSRRDFVGTTALGAAALAIGGCHLRDPTILRAGYVKVLAALPFMFAIKAGYFADVGLNVEGVEFTTSNDVATAGVTGAVDFIGAGATNACLDAMTASAKLMQLFTMNNYVKRPNRQSTDFLLSAGKFRTIESLKGQSVAFFPGSFGKMFAGLILPKLGLQISDIKYVEMQPSQWLAALQSGSISAVTALEPVATKIMATLPVNVLVDGYYATVMQNVPGSGSWFRAGHLDHKTELKVNEAMMRSITKLTTDRAAAIVAIQELFSLDHALAAQVRMLDWKSSTNPVGRTALEQFGALLWSQKAIARPLPPSDQWIWQETA